MYLFINRYCKITADIPGKGIVTLTGWIPFANAEMLLLIDEEGDEIPIDRKDLYGSIVVLLEQKQLAAAEITIQ